MLEHKVSVENSCKTNWKSKVCIKYYHLMLPSFAQQTIRILRGFGCACIPNSLSSLYMTDCWFQSSSLLMYRWEEQTLDSGCSLKLCFCTFYVCPVISGIQEVFYPRQPGYSLLHTFFITLFIHVFVSMLGCV